MKSPRITFLGAAGTVTGSKYLVEMAGARLLVDCGLFQGFKALRERNWIAPPFEPASIDAVVLTHAHIDHTGYLPRLCKAGFHGRIYCTPGTRDLLRILLPDAGHLQEEEAQHANRRGHSKHHPALPLYTLADAEACLPQITPVDFHATFRPAAEVTARFTRAGHILGAASLILEAASRSIAFSGDVGRNDDPIMRPPEPLPQADYLVVESTYGDRRHPPENVLEILASLVTEAVQKKGTLVIPAFAVGRAQHLLHMFDRLRQAGEIPDIPIFLDSPMAIEATEIFCRYPEDHRLNPGECRSLSAAARYTRSREESEAIDKREGPMIVISASGMATGGRILFHLRRFLPEEKNTVLIVGFQASGTRGRSLVDGADEIKMFGNYVPVRAQVREIRGLSAHADYAEIIDWLRRSPISPRRVFVTHGEPSAADAFRRRVQDAFGWKVVVPADGVSVNLE